MSEISPVVGPGRDVPARASVDESEGVTPQGLVKGALWLSAVRCALTYVVGPAAGVLGAALNPLGLLLQIVGVCTAAYGAMVLRRRGNRLWTLYAVVACGLWAATLWAITRSR